MSFVFNDRQHLQSPYFYFSIAHPSDLKPANGVGERWKIPLLPINSIIRTQLQSFASRRHCALVSNPPGEMHPAIHIHSSLSSQASRANIIYQLAPPRTIKRKSPSISKVVIEIDRFRTERHCTYQFALGPFHYTALWIWIEREPVERVKIRKVSA